MKSRFLTILIVLSAIMVSGQDIIYLKEGGQRTGKVTDILQEEVIYHHNSDGSMTGPKVHLKKSEIKTIVYENGEIETFSETVKKPVSQPQEPSRVIETVKVDQDARISYYDKSGKTFKVGSQTLTRQEIEPYMMKNPQAYMYFKKYKSSRGLSVAWNIIGPIVFWGMAIPAVIAESVPLYYSAAGFALAWAAVAIPINSSKKKNLDQAVRKYNQGLPYTYHDRSVNMSLGSTRNGVGLIVSF